MSDAGLILFAHGLVQRSSLPLPEWLFAWAASAALVVSFVALAVLWPSPRLEHLGWRPLPDGIGRVIGVVAHYLTSLIFEGQSIGSLPPTHWGRDRTCWGRRPRRSTTR